MARTTPPTYWRISIVFFAMTAVFLLTLVVHVDLSSPNVLLLHLALLGLFCVFQSVLGYFLLKNTRAMWRSNFVLESLLQEAPFGMCTVSADGRIAKCNAAMAGLLGKQDAARASGMDAATLFGGRDQALGPMVENALSGKGFDHEVRIPLGEESAWYRVSGVSAASVDGIPRQLMLIAEDITPQRRLSEITEEQSVKLEEDVRKRTAALTALEELYRTVLEVNLVGIYVMQDGVFRYVNPAFQRMFGYADPADMVGVYWESLCTPAGIAQAKANGIMARLRGEGIPRQYVVECKRKDGSVFLLEVYSSPSVYGGKPAIVGSARDVTEETRNRTRMSELHDLQASFINIVSHQLRTPLNSIRWNMESMLDGEFGKLTASQRDFMQSTLDADVEVIRRIHGLLVVIDIEEGTILLRDETFSLEDVWNDVWNEYAVRCEQRKLHCTRRSVQRLPTMRGDREKIREAMAVLLNNAVLYTPGDGRIEAKLEVKDGHVRLTVTDTGIGIPAVEQDKIFMRFFRSTNAILMHPNASGVGLSIAKYYVEQHGGSIGFVSEETKGSTFWIDLPHLSVLA